LQSAWLETSLIIWSGVGAFAGWQIYQGNPRFYSTLLMPHVHYFFEPEKAHRFAVKFMSLGLVYKSKFNNELILVSFNFYVSVYQPHSTNGKTSKMNHISINII